MKEIVLVMGFPGSGKSTVTKSLIAKGFKNYNRDLIGSTDKLLDQLQKDITGGGTDFVLDNTYGTKASRAPIIKIAKDNGFTISCTEMSTTLEEAQFNAVQRQIERLGKYPTPEELKAANDVNLFPPVVIYSYKNKYEKPDKAEGFDFITKLQFIRNEFPADYINKAVIFDYDGTLRDTISGAKYPIDPSDVKILPGRIEKLKQLKAEGYILLGLSNQSGIAKGKLTMDAAKACFKKTNDLLGFDIDVEFCSHSIPPVVCFCRKPAPGYGVHFIHKYKLDPKQTVMVGDMTSDKTFAARCGFQYVDQSKFF